MTGRQGPCAQRSPRSDRGWIGKRSPYRRDIAPPRTLAGSELMSRARSAITSSTTASTRSTSPSFGRESGTRLCPATRGRRPRRRPPAARADCAALACRPADQRSAPAPRERSRQGLWRHTRPAREGRKAPRGRHRPVGVGPDDIPAAGEERGGGGPTAVTCSCAIAYTRSRRRGAAGSAGCGVSRPASGSACVVCYVGRTYARLQSAPATNCSRCSSQARVSGDRAETLARRERRALWHSRGRLRCLSFPCRSDGRPPRGLTAERP
jgi:hypothetical protein